jgi:small subunit ribosomal protein S6
MPTLTPSSEDVRIYECTILYPLLSQKDESALLKEVDALFAEAGATLVAKDAWGRRGLAYAIKGQTEGNFVVYYWEMDPLKLKEVDAQLRIMKNLMRHIFVKPPKNYQIVKYSEAYETWLKERETMDQKKMRVKEEAAQERLAKRAVQTKKAPKKVEEKSAGPVVQEELTEKLEKLISDDTSNL